MKIVEGGARRDRRLHHHLGAARDQRLAPYRVARFGVDHDRSRDLEQPRARLDAQAAIEHHARVGLLRPSQPSIERRIVGQHRSAPHQQRVVLLAQTESPTTPGGRRDPPALAGRGRDLAVEAHRPLERDLGTRQQLRHHEAQVELDRLAVERSPLHFDAGLAQAAEAPAPPCADRDRRDTPPRDARPRRAPRRRTAVSARDGRTARASRRASRPARARPRRAARPLRRGPRRERGESPRPPPPPTHRERSRPPSDWEPTR